jgi:hypothetical protein
LLKRLFPPQDREQRVDGTLRWQTGAKGRGQYPAALVLTAALTDGRSRIQCAPPFSVAGWPSPAEVKRLCAMHVDLADKAWVKTGQQSEWHRRKDASIFWARQRCKGKVWDLEGERNDDFVRSSIGRMKTFVARRSAISMLSTSCTMPRHVIGATVYHFLYLPPSRFISPAGRSFELEICRLTATRDGRECWTFLYSCDICWAFCFDEICVRARVRVWVVIKLWDSWRTTMHRLRMTTLRASSYVLGWI